jgi:AraC-like DNA-binding protein
MQAKTQTQVFIRARAMTGLKPLVHALGGDVVALMSKFDLDAKLLDEPDAILPLDRLSALMEDAAVVLNCPDFGLRLSTYQDIGVLGSLACIALYAHTALDAIEGIARHLPYHSPGLSLTLVNDEASGLSHACYALHSIDPTHTQIVELSYGIAYQFMKSIFGEDSKGVTVHLRHAPVSTPAGYLPFFDCPLLFGQSRDALVFPQTLLGHVIDTKNGDLYDAAARFVGHTMRRFPLDIGLQVETLVDRQLANGGGNVVRIAEQLNLSRSSLHRRLAQQGLSFEGIVDAVRRRRSEEYLGLPSVPLHELAALLGYTNGVSLHRSFMRWFGQSPSSLRAQRAAEMVAHDSA